MEKEIQFVKNILYNKAAEVEWCYAEIMDIVKTKLKEMKLGNKNVI